MAASVSVIAAHVAGAHATAAAFFTELARRTRGAHVTLPSAGLISELVVAASIAPDAMHVHIDTLRAAKALTPALEAMLKPLEPESRSEPLQEPGPFTDAWWVKPATSTILEVTTGQAATTATTTQPMAIGAGSSQRPSKSLPRLSSLLSPKTKPHDIRVCLLGAKHVGKTCIGLRFAGGFYKAEYEPTIDDVYRKQVLVEG
jgi:hypothetical protein